MTDKSLGIGKKYLRHFVRNIDSRFVITIGGRRSGKSFATYKWLNFIASGKTVKIMVVSASHPALMLTIEDFQNATGNTVKGSLLYGYSSILRNGSVFQFRSFDDSRKVQGTWCDILYVEEFLNVPEDVIRVASMSVREQIYMCANPTKKSRIIDDYRTDTNYLATTYKDNPYLTDEQVREFEMIKERSLLPNATMYDIYCAKVYCDGEFSELVGRCFERLEHNTYDEYLQIPSQEIIVMDLAFGGADKTAICGFKKYENRLYVHTYNYSQGTIYPKELALTLIGCGFNQYTVIYSDYGGIGRQVMDSLITAANGEWTEDGLCRGFSIANVIKTSVKEEIMSLMALDAIVIDDSSDYTRMEFENATLDENGRLEGQNDHSIATARYAINIFHKGGY